MVSNNNTEENIIWNSYTEHLYINKYSWKKFWNITFEEQDFDLSKRVRITLVIDPSWELENFKLKKIKQKKWWKWESDQEISFSTFSIKKITSFLNFLVENISKIEPWKIELSEIATTEKVTKDQLTKFLETEEGREIVKEVLDKKTTKEDIINFWYRKEQLKIFNELLDWNLNIEEFRDTEIKENKKIIERYWLTENSKKEKIWQYFFEKNEWIFWYGLDYRFMWILQREIWLNPPTAWWKDEVKWDYLIWDNKYVHFVEIKLPDTPLFWNKRNRANSWELSKDLFDSKSQILEQKAWWLTRFNQNHWETDLNWEKIDWKAYDSKTILIIWNLDKEVQIESIFKDRQIKEKTFELFRNDSKSIEIITYDELCNRANFIVNWTS